MTENLRGALWMMLAMLCFAVEDAFFKSATGNGWLTPGVGTFLFGVIAMVIYGIIAGSRGYALWHPAYLQRALLLRTAAETMGRLFFALSLAFNTLTVTSTILQAAPIVVTLGAVAFFGERAGPRRWTAMAVGMVGVLLVLRPVPAQFEPTVVFAVLGMLGFALRDLATRAAPSEVQPAQLGLLGFAVVTVAGLVIMAFEPGAPSLPTAQGAGFMVLTAIAGVIAYDSLTRAMRAGDVSATAPFRYIRLVAALAIGMLVFGERPDTLTWAGAALIVGAGLFTLWRDARKPATARPNQ
jgi:drug/metabolite transporter (DMT)-like permease